jgi:hypothetical protein
MLRRLLHLHLTVYGYSRLSILDGLPRTNIMSLCFLDMLKGTARKCFPLDIAFTFCCRYQPKTHACIFTAFASIISCSRERNTCATVEVWPQIAHPIVSTRGAIQIFVLFDAGWIEDAEGGFFADIVFCVCFKPLRYLDVFSATAIK